MTNEQAKSELMQIYMSLSEEKKKALDVAFKAMEQAQNCDQCEAGNPCLYCEHEFKAQAEVNAHAIQSALDNGTNTVIGTAQADNLPVMYYPQVDGITPTVVAQADGEYISRNNAITSICQWGTTLERTGIYTITVAEMKQTTTDMLCELPSVAIPNKVGHWKLLDECSNAGYYCSECKKRVVKEGWSETVKRIKFCPNCGAKMD